MKAKYIIIAFFLSTISVFSACSKTEKAEKVEAVEEAEQAIDAADVLEAAKLEGRNAAREFLGKELPDTFSIHGALLDVKARKSKYERKNNKAAQAAFDSAFVKTLHTVRPDIARHLTSTSSVDSNSDSK